MPGQLNQRDQAQSPVENPEFCPIYLNKLTVFQWKRPTREKVEI